MIQRKKILIVEDNSMVIALLRHILEKENFELQIVNDGNEGILAVGTPNLDLIIMDVMLPYRSGFEVISHAKKVNREVPIIILSSLGRVDNTIRDANNLGVFQVLSKPFSATELLSRIHFLMDQKPFKEPKKTGAPKRPHTAPEVKPRESSLGIHLPKKL
ncbi:MAG: response regulator [Bacteroidota bacterium]